MKQLRELKLWVIIFTGLVAFVLSIVWYSPLMFGSIWLKYRHPPNPSIPEWTIVFAPLREILAAYVVNVLLVRMSVVDVKASCRLMLLLWVAFHAVGMAGAVLWDNMQWQLGAVHAGDWLMKLVFIGSALTILRRRTVVAGTINQ